ncbi:MAG TPA: carboxypeptidase-like regulatory domain-containing protein [Puia sp.]|nr:carboxypeptidase-like regulatory domain-containing protein [Puia sp.]
MKKNLFLLVGSFLIAAASRAQPGNTLTTITLTGKVTDSATGKPIPGCSVYINSTSLGTVSSTDGSFRLHNVPQGRSELVISAIGYQTYVTEISGSSLPDEWKVRLRPKITELSAVTVEPYDKNGWVKYGQVFLDNFIGTAGNENVSSCTLRNHKVLRFFFSKKNNRLSVSATEPLIIENQALGYHIQYQLEQFSLDFNRHVVLYLGYPLFQEIPTNRKRLLRERLDNRRHAYLGSLRQFVRSLYYDCPGLQGFSMKLPQMVLNPEKQWVRKVYNPEFSPDNYPEDSLKLYRDILAQPDYLEKTVPIATNDLVNMDRQGTRILYFTDALEVYYKSDKADKAERNSKLTLVTPSPVVLEADGGFYPPKELLASGRWASTEKICNLLPFNYQLPEETSPIP